MGKENHPAYNAAFGDLRQKLQDDLDRAIDSQKPVDALFAPDGEDELDFALAVQDVANVNVALLLRKHRDYGPKNISQSPGGALNGLRVRMHDKLARINHLLESGADPENESLIDSFVDLGNYALIAQLVLRGEWPNE